MTSTAVLAKMMFGSASSKIELLRARILLRLLQHVALQLAELLVAAQIQILEILVLRALQLALPVANLPLES